MRRPKRSPSSATEPNVAGPGRSFAFSLCHGNHKWSWTCAVQQCNGRLLHRNNKGIIFYPLLGHICVSDDMKPAASLRSICTLKRQNRLLFTPRKAGMENLAAFNWHLKQRNDHLTNLFSVLILTTVVGRNILPCHSPCLPVKSKLKDIRMPPYIPTLLLGSSLLGGVKNAPLRLRVHHPLWVNVKCMSSQQRACLGPTDRRGASPRCHRGLGRMTLSKIIQMFSSFCSV